MLQNHWLGHAACAVVVSCLSMPALSTGVATPGTHQQFVFSGQIDYVFVNSSPTLLTGLDIGSTVQGTFRYGVDAGSATVTPHGDNETDYEFLGPAYFASLDSSEPAIDIQSVTVVASDNTYIDGSVANELGQLLGVSIQGGDPFDAWTVRTDEEPVNGIALAVSFMAFTNVNLLGDQFFNASPPAGIGSGGFDGAVFHLLEADANGDVIFEAIGSVDSYSANAVSNYHPGDANGDGMVNLADLQILGDNWQAGAADWSMADFTGDGVVNLADLQILGDNWGFGIPADVAFADAVDLVGVPVPEPTTLALLVACAAFIARRRSSGR